ncbi:MAG: type II toxin-antitoxin system VapC family toxin [Proteobacteria bacterium]|nr:type II toxin-antitoxin system VapC family toxin [Pseudomonadota bacterium]
MKLFFDTSALVKFFHEEDGSREVTNLIISPENEICVSELVRLEFLSALFRRFRNKEIDEDKLNRATTGFEEEFIAFRVEPLRHVVLEEAESLLKKFGSQHGLRTLDALHLATFTLIAKKDWTFAASDENLCNVVRLLGYKTINPLKK